MSWSQENDRRRVKETDMAAWVWRALVTVGCSPQDRVTLKGVNADWAEARQFAHVQTCSLQRAQTGFTADAGISLQIPLSLLHLFTSFYALLSLTSSKFPLRSFILELVPLAFIVEPLWAHCEQPLARAGVHYSKGHCPTLQLLWPRISRIFKL